VEDENQKSNIIFSFCLSLRPWRSWWFKNNEDSSLRWRSVQNNKQACYPLPRHVTLSVLACPREGEGLPLP